MCSIPRAISARAEREPRRNEESVQRAGNSEIGNMLFTSRLSLAAIALPLALTPLMAVDFRDGAAFAQSGGSSGGSAGGGAGGGTSGPTGAGSSTGTGMGSGTVSPGINSAPSTSTPGIGPQSRSPATPPSTVPQVDTGVPPVPSAGNAEPNSPIYRQDTPPGALTPQPNSTNPADLGTEGRASQTDAPPGGSGGSSTGRSVAPGSGDPLVPTDPAGNPAREGSGRAADSISEEPNRVTRGGAAGKDLDECMRLWDAGTHMTKEQWKGTCERLGR